MQKQRLTPEEGQLLFKAFTHYNTSTVESPTEAQLEHFTQLGHKLLPEPKELQESESEEVLNALYYYESCYILELTGTELMLIQTIQRKLDGVNMPLKPAYQVPADGTPGPDRAITLTRSEQALYMHIMHRYLEMYCDELPADTLKLMDSLWRKVMDCQPTEDEPLQQLPERPEWLINNGFI